MSLSLRTGVARATLVLLAWVLCSTTARAQDGQPAPPDATVYGMTMPDWAAAWIQWRYSLPRSVDPDAVGDTTGERSGIGQRAPVWFLPVFNAGAGTRTYTVPEGHAILAVAGWNLFVAPPGKYTDDELLARVDTGFLDRVAASNGSAQLDGVTITDWKRFRVLTPVFTITLPPDNLFGIPVTPGEDTRVAAVAGGHFFLFPPLPVGGHVYHVRVVSANIDGTSILIVQKPNAPPR
jgi:hypothetical protein